LDIMERPGESRESNGSKISCPVRRQEELLGDRYPHRLIIPI
jgi:hypothetical protein